MFKKTAQFVRDGFPYVDDTGMMIIVLAEDDDKKLSNGMMNDVGQIGNLFRQK